MLTSTQAQTAKAIVNIFETGSVRGRYSEVTLLPGDSGHLTYGRSQTTLGSGNLYLLVNQYCEAAGARFAMHLSPYLPRLKKADTTLDSDMRFKNLLRASGDDVVMRDTQDNFFDTVYWAQAIRYANQSSIKTPLGVAVVYDSTVHGSWTMVRNKTNARAGDITIAGEMPWIHSYVSTRRDWLLNHVRPVLRSTFYRMDAFLSLIDQGYWNLDLPLVVRNLEISQATLQAPPDDCFNGPFPGSRSLQLTSPLQRGMDVRLVQLGLGDSGVNIKADGIYGRTTAELITKCQRALKLPATGIADAGLVMELVKSYV
jgi:chitosanase